MTPISLLLTLVASAVMSTAAPLERRRVPPPTKPPLTLALTLLTRLPSTLRTRILPLVNASVDTANTTVTAYYKLNNAVTSVPLLSNNADALNRPYLYIPSHTATGRFKRPVYDSASGKNFNFVIHGGIIKFNTDSKSVVEGSLKAGTPVGIAYDPARSPCTVKPDEATQTITATGSPTVNLTESTVTIPAEKVVAGELQVFFSCQTAIGSAWDSAFGKNWRFTVTA
ncbi:hypothetical protein BC829DRAFT_418575 [Chytridium lagenaria]|nr:hypothetical protein BC829DRAFT_418575 [Chytridium lagenaria]